ncbi:site-specific integrase [Neobacillus sp. YX16]|uniref:site-specific integrase n=1 Tax=Neobacillus sp. YX16 TaxID=3047874 RepID=UPI0024C37158|nr:site-specific integrase [Neobacillus sp. YX16]WHZ05859.1 site-specific integrase [Neobacillus sp. YX16]
MEFVQPIRDINKIEEMKEKLSPRDSFMFTLGINVGCRISDLLQLKVKDIRGKSHLCIEESKTGKTKRFLINNSLKEVVYNYTEDLDPESWLFPSRKGDKPITRVQAYRVLNKTAQEIGLDEIGTHTLRKTFGYWFYKRTMDVAMLQEIFNHSAPSITLRYIGINQDNMDEALKDFTL